MCRRRHQISHNKHLEIGGLEKEDQETFLDKLENGEMSNRDNLRKAVREYKN